MQADGAGDLGAPAAAQGRPSASGSSTADERQAEGTETPASDTPNAAAAAAAEAEAAATAAAQAAAKRDADAARLAAAAVPAVAVPAPAADLVPRTGSAISDAAALAVMQVGLGPELTVCFRLCHRTNIGVCHAALQAKQQASIPGSWAQGGLRTLLHSIWCWAASLCAGEVHQCPPRCRRHSPVRHVVLIPQVLQLAVHTLRPNIVEVALDLIHKLIAFR